MSLNISSLCGRLTADPILRKTQNGKSTTSFKIAVDRDFKQEGQPTADYIPVVAWNVTADNVAKYCQKGSQVNVKGRIQTRNYDGADGKKIYITEIVAESVQFLGVNKAHENSESSVTNEYSQNEEIADETLEIISDDLPF